MGGILKRVGVEVKDWKATELIQRLRPAVESYDEAVANGIPNPELRVRFGSSDVGKQLTLGARSNAANLGCSSSQLFLPSETGAELSKTTEGKAILRFLLAMGSDSPIGFDPVDSGTVALGTGAVG